MEARADPAAQAAGSRIPSAPYPGLRPFLDHEEILLFGRERQVREVIERLRETQFVAVIGGSGSGKSSLILAGVVPELRSFGIPGAGDYWVPLVCTPGTNATLEDQQQHLNTPISRLARKFAALLKSRGSEAADEERLQEIGACLRKERGLARLVRQFTPELDAPAGPNPQDARFLFVIDQFEELFHPTTRRADDARLLIERVIDHFFSPDPRCYLVLTMRSEHLNDCAGFLELPDAINKASYLVPRLGPEQLRAAIVGPAERLLRLHQRADDDAARLPDAVSFDPAVVERLLADTRRLDANPDHLPLLQHVLARLWDAATRRVAGRLDLPDGVLPEDLAVAASARPPGEAAAPAEGVNVLIESLECWAEASYTAFDEAGRGRIDTLLRRLGVKDPNTGMYSQERIAVDEAARLVGLPSAAELRGLLGRGFVGDVDYLFWDDADPRRVTLKVSHESFIRGWARLRTAIDDEAERFTVFVDLLRRAADWQHEGRQRTDLLETADLRRLDEARLQPLLADGAERARWFRRLESTHAYAHLAGVQADVDDFVRDSLQRQLDRAAAEQKRQRNRRWVVVAALLALPPLAYWMLIQGPVIHRISLMFGAGALANSTPLRPSQSAVGSETKELGLLLQAAVMLDQGYQGMNEWTRLNRVLVEHLSGVPFVRLQARVIDQVMAGNEPVVNGSLRDLLQAWVWHGGETFKEETVALSEPQPGQRCTVYRSAGGAGPVPAAAEPVGSEQTGALFTASNPSAGAGSNATRSIFVPDQSGRDDELEIRAATVDGAKQCTSRQQVISIPLALYPVVGFDANLRNLLYATDEAGSKTVTVTEIDWEQPTRDSSFSVKTLPPVVLTGAEDAQRLIKSIGERSGVPARPATLVTLRVRGGRTIMVGDQAWRLVDELAQRVGPPHLTPEQSAAGAGLPLRKLQPSRTDSACLQLVAGLDRQERERKTGFTTQAFEDPPDQRHCFVIQWGAPDSAAARAGDGSSAGHAVRYRLVAAVYPMPGGSASDAGQPLPAPIARMPRFGRTIAPEGATWWVGLPDSEYAGWLASANEARSGELRFVATPWSTCALWRLGREIYAQQPKHEAQSLALGDADTCRGR